MKKLIILVCFIQLFSNYVHSKSTILFLGDGMGITTITAARIYEGQAKGVDGESHSLSFENFDNVAFIKTYSADAQIPDSAGTMSAIMTGQKTRSGVISVGPEYDRGDCESVLKDSRTTIIELAEKAGLKTGIITTARITDATPAATYAHASDRTWENDSKIPEVSTEKGCTDIANQFAVFSYGDGIDLAFGGGRSNFHASTTPDLEYSELVGARTDGRDLINEWVTGGQNRRFIWNLEQFNNLSYKGQILGLFEPLEMQYEVERAKDGVGEPSISDMAAFAVKYFQEIGDDYFLVIEGARIDHANHNKDPYLALTDTVEFSNAIQKVLDLVDLEETMILVTADHSSALAFSGYPTRGMPVLGSLSYPEFSFTGGMGFQGGHLEKDAAVRQQFLANLQNNLAAHAGEDVPAYATGHKSELVKGVMEQNVLFDVILDSLDINQ
mgnify:CR=1 FL=1